MTADQLIEALRRVPGNTQIAIDETGIPGTGSLARSMSFWHIAHSTGDQQIVVNTTERKEWQDQLTYVGPVICLSSSEE